MDKIVKIIKQYYDNIYLQEKMSAYRVKVFNSLIPKLNPNGFILDVGCGTGDITKSIKVRKKVGIDISKSSIKIAKNNIKLVCIADCFNLPFREKIFSGIIAIGTPEYMNPKMLLRFLRETTASLVNDGKIIITVGLKRDIIRKIVRYTISKLKRRRSKPYFSYRYDLTEIKGVLDKASLKLSDLCKFSTTKKPFADMNMMLICKKA